MPRNSINSNGTLDPVTISLTASQIVEYLVWNHTGSTLTVTQDIADKVAIQIHEEGGNSSDLDTGSYKLGPDECIHLVIINQEGVSNDVTLSFEGGHSLISTGTRHTPNATNFPGIYVAQV